MPQGNTVLQIPIFQNRQAHSDSLVNGLYATLDSFKAIMIERIDRVESKLKEINDKKFPDPIKDIKKIQNDIEDLKQGISKLDNIKSEIINVTNTNVEGIFKNNFNNLIAMLSDNVNEYFKANTELLNKFQIIEQNVKGNIDSLKESIKHQVYEPLDYLFITENFKQLKSLINETKRTVDVMVKDRENIKYKNPYILELVNYKDLPIAEFSPFSKAVVYRYGFLKRIAFFKNDGNSWIKL